MAEHNEQPQTPDVEQFYSGDIVSLSDFADAVIQEHGFARQDEPLIIDAEWYSKQDDHLELTKECIDNVATYTLVVSDPAFMQPEQNFFWSEADTHAVLVDGDGTVHDELTEVEIGLAILFHLRQSNGRPDSEHTRAGIAQTFWELAGTYALSQPKVQNALSATKEHEEKMQRMAVRRALTKENLGFQREVLGTLVSRALQKPQS